MAKLNQLIAVVDGAKTRTREKITACYHKLQQKGLLTGLSRAYRPKDDDGEQLPSETNLLQVRAKEVLAEALEVYGELWEGVLGLDIANTAARADIVVDNVSLAVDIPVTNLLFLNKQLTDFATMIKSIPVVDPSYEWEYSEQADCYATKPMETVKTKKIPKSHIKYEATKEHPAQVDVYPEDVVVGTWIKTEFSGAMLASEKAELLTRVTKLQDAVKVAREEGNSLPVQKETRLAAMLEYLKK